LIKKLKIKHKNMEILLAIGVSFFLQAFKWLSNKFGKKATKNAVYLLLFSVSLLVTILTESNLVSWDMINEYSRLLLLSVGFYESMIKRLAPYLLDTMNKTLKKTKV